MPSAFDLRRAAATYARADTGVRYLIHRRAERLRDRLKTLRSDALTADGSQLSRRRVGPGGVWNETVRRLRTHGIQVGALGLELTENASLPTAEGERRAVTAALELMVFADAVHDGTAHPLPGNSAWARMLWKTDAPLFTRPAPPLPPPPPPPPPVSAPRESSGSWEEDGGNGLRDASGGVAATAATAASPMPQSDPATSSRPSTAAAPLLEALRRDGFVRIDSFGLDVHALRAQAREALSTDGRRASHGELITTQAHLPALEPLLVNESIGYVVRSYLGGSARFDGHATFTLTEHATRSNYPSGWFHHDRCGRRLRLFVFIHDIDPAGRPTLAARGSHRTFAYYVATSTSARTREPSPPPYTIDRC